MKRKFTNLSRIIFFVIAIPFIIQGEASANSDGKTVDSQSAWEFLKGQPTSNKFFLGMFTFHFTPSSLESRNWNNKLIAIQYNDFFLGTLENSFYNRSWVFGIARNFSRSKVSNNWEITTGYRLGGATGYEDGEAPFSGSSPVIPVVELYTQAIGFEHFGIELMLTTSLSLGLFYQF